MGPDLQRVQDRHRFPRIKFPISSSFGALGFYSGVGLVLPHSRWGCESPLSPGSEEHFGDLGAATLPSPAQPEETIKTRGIFVP